MSFREMEQFLWNAASGRAAATRGNLDDPKRIPQAVPPGHGCEAAIEEYPEKGTRYAPDTA